MAIGYAKLTTEKKIERRANEITPLFTPEIVGKDKMPFVKNLIQQLAVTTVTLERITEEINAGDILEEFHQGTQHFRRENPAIKVYNATVKSFSTLSKQLLDLLPESSADQAGAALDKFRAKPVGGARQ